MMSASRVAGILFNHAVAVKLPLMSPPSSKHLIARYKNSLRGYGGFQKFLVARKGAGDASSRLRIAEDGARVTIVPAEADHPSEGRESTLEQGDVLPTAEMARRCEGLLGQERLPSRVVTTAGDITTAAAAAAVAEVPDNRRSEVDDRESSADGATLPSSTRAIQMVSAAASSLTLSRSVSSCTEGNAPDENRPPATPPAFAGEYRDGDRNGIGGRSAIKPGSRRLTEQGPLTVECLSGVELVCGDIFQEAW